MGKVNRYMAAQRENAVLNAQTSQDLRKSLADQLDKFSSTQQTHSDALAQSIASQAKHMEESLKSLVEDLVRQSHSAIAEQKLQLNRYCETTAASREGAFKHFDNLSIQQNEGLVEVFNQLNKQVGTDGQRHVALCNEASQARLATDTSLKAVSGSVLIQKQKLEETVSDVVQRVDQSVKNGCEVIQSTSLVANKVVTDVSNASQSMSIKATESMGEFKEFLEDTGTKLSTQLSTHFSDLDEHMKSQEASLIQVEGQLNSFSETILAIQVTPTGATPKKQKFASLPVLVATRDHEEIKGEIREAASNAQFQPGQPNQTDKIETTKLINDSQPSPFEDIENLNPDIANIIPVDLKSSTGKELLSKSLLPKATRTSKSSQDSDAVSVLSAGAGLRVRSKVL